MSAKKGSQILIKRASTVICTGIVTKKIKYGGEAIDITSDDDSGWRELMTVSGLKSIDISFDGVAKDVVLRGYVTSDSRSFTDVTLEFETGDKITGNWFLSSYEESGKTNDKVEFSAELQSSGVMTFVAHP